MSGASLSKGGQAAKVEAIFHPVISVSSMESALAFYRDILGLRVTFDDFHEPAAISQLFGYDDPVVRSALVRCPDESEIELVEFQKPRGRLKADRTMADAGLAALNLRVTGIEDLMVRISEAGYGFPSGLVRQVLPDGAILKVAVCDGPDAVKVLLVEPPPGQTSF